MKYNTSKENSEEIYLHLKQLSSFQQIGFLVTTVNLKTKYFLKYFFLENNIFPFLCYF